MDSTRYKGGILLVNEDNLLSADYVPEALVDDVPTLARALGVTLPEAVR